MQVNWRDGFALRSEDFLVLIKIIVLGCIPNRLDGTEVEPTEKLFQTWEW
jgi:hypothetical protein